MLNLKSLNLVLSAGMAGILISMSGAQDINKLTAEEAKAGYDLLFNGVDLDNWHAYREDKVTDAWVVKTNAPLGVRIENKSGDKKSILTDKKFKNFDFKVDVQVPNTGNSGIFTRYEETALNAGDARSGPEFQVCGPSDNDCVEPEKRFGASYDMFAVKASARDTWYKTEGNWNQVRIIAYDSNYVHYGNGKKLLEYKIGTAEYFKAYNSSKYASDGNNGRYYDIHFGGLLLQHHGETGIAYRNLKAKELKVIPFNQEFPDGKWPDSLDQNYVFGKRGCTDVNAAAYDATAEVDDGTCAGAGINSPGRLASLPVSTVRGGSGAVLVRLPFEHDGFQAMGFDGRAVASRKIGEGVYSIGSQGHGVGIAIVRFRVGGRVSSRIVNLQ